MSAVEAIPPLKIPRAPLNLVAQTAGLAEIVPPPAPVAAIDDRSDQRRTPVLAALRRHRAAGTVAFSTPGHKGGAGIDPDLREILGGDVFAADVWLNAGEHAAMLAEAESLAAAAWGADRAWFLLNGSTGGNHAALLATVRPEDEVIVARDAHRSVLAALIASGANPVWIAPRLHPKLHVGLGVSADDVAAALDAHPGARLVVMGTPSYWGISADTAAVAATAHARGVPLYVDEAWGPHLPFHPALPTAAIKSGADLVVTSAHKLLGCLGQGAILAAGHSESGRIDVERIAAAVRLTQTTSPSLPILASLDACRRQMALYGEALLARTIALAEDARSRLAALPGVEVLAAGDVTGNVARFDPTRLVIDAGGIGLTGYALERELRGRFGVAPEMSDLVGIVCLVTIGDDRRSLDRLVGAIATLAAERGVRGSWDAGAAAARAWFRSSGGAIAPGRQALTPREAFLAPARPVSLLAAIGEIAAESVVPYPPGIPVLVPGEVIAAEKVAYLRHGLAHGMHVSGVADPTLATVQVVK
jgi:arginine/lysine/ornithine decarboxylase